MLMKGRMRTAVMMLKIRLLQTKCQVSNIDSS